MVRVASGGRAAAAVRSPALPPMFFRTVRRTSLELLLSPAARVTSWNESAAYLVREPTFELTVEGRMRIRASGRQSLAATSASRPLQQSAFRDSLLELRAELADASAGSRVPPVGTRAVAGGASSAHRRRAGAGAAPVPLERVEVAVRTDDTHAFEARRVLDVGASEYLRCSLVIPLHRPAPGAPIRVQLRAAVLARPLPLPLPLGAAASAAAAAAALASSSANAEQRSRAEEQMSDGFVRWPLPDALAYTQLQYAPDNSGDDSIRAAAAAVGLPVINSLA